MSIYICSECEQQLDGDFTPCFEYDEKEVCEECYHKLVDMFGRDEKPDLKVSSRPDWDCKDSDYL